MNILNNPLEQGPDANILSEAPQDMLQIANAEPDEEPNIEMNHLENLVFTLDKGFLDTLSDQVWKDTEREEASYSDYDNKTAFFLDLTGFQFADENPGAKRGAAGDDYIKNTGTSNLYSTAMGETLLSIVNTVISRFFDQDKIVSVNTTFPSQDPNQQVSPEIIEGIKQRVERWYTVYLNHIVKNYKEDLTKTLMWACSNGVGSRKCYFDPARGYPTSQLIQPGMLMSNSGFDSFLKGTEYTHKYYLTRSEVQRKIDDSIWDADIMNSNAVTEQESIVNNKLMAMEGKSPDMRTNTSDDRDELIAIYERYQDLVMEDGETIPVIVIYSQDGALGAVYPNYRLDDPLKLPIDYLVNYSFMPSFHGQSMGLANVAGQNARAATILERRLIDSSLAAAFPAAFVKPTVKFQAHTFEGAPGKVTTLPVGDDDIGKAITFAPTATPNPFMADLKKDLEDGIRRYSLLVSQDMMDLAQRAPQGSVLAMLSRLEEMPNAIIEGFYKSFEKELSIFKRMFFEWLPDDNTPFTINMNGDTYTIYKYDFSEYVQIAPSCSYSRESDAYRFMRSEIITQQAQQNPQLHNLYGVYTHFYKEMGLKDDVIQSILLPPQEPNPADIILNEAKQLPQIHDMRSVLGLYYQSKNIPPEIVQMVLPEPHPQQQQQQIDPGIVGMAEVEAQKQIAELNAQVKMAQLESDRHETEAKMQIEMAKLQLKEMEQQRDQLEIEMRILKDQQEIALRDKDIQIKEQKAELEHYKYERDKFEDAISHTDVTQ